MHDLIESFSAASGLRRRRFPASFVTTPGASRPRTTTVLSLSIIAMLPCSPARRSGRPACSTARASVVGVPLTSLYHWLLDALRAMPPRAPSLVPFAESDASAFPDYLAAQLGLG